jgi:hypothetical protein
MLPLARVKGFGRPSDEVTEGATELSATLTVREAVRRNRDARPAVSLPSARRGGRSF